jgi:hypothetical protein
MQQRLEYLGAKIDPSTMAIVRHIAELERRSVSNVLRNLLADWAARQARRLRLDQSSERKSAA